MAQINVVIKESQRMKDAREKIRRIIRALDKMGRGDALHDNAPEAEREDGE